MNGDDIDHINIVLVEGMPVFTHWHTVIPSIKIFIKNNIVMYSFAVVVKQEEKPGSYLYSCACDVIGLMNIRAKDLATNTVDANNSLVVLTQLNLINGFTEAIYSNHFTMACQPNPKFGSDSQGHTYHLCVERCFVTKNQILKFMDDDGLEKCPSFAAYVKALKGISSLGQVKLGGQELITKIEEAFFEEFLASYSGHFESFWRSDRILPYILGGNPRVAQLFTS